MSALLYKPLLYIHILAGFVYMLSHGASAAAAFRLRQETNPDRIRALLDLSVHWFGLMYLSLAGLIVAGIALAFAGRWWGRGWVWVALALLIAVLVAMSLLASQHFHRIRKAVGLPFRAGNKEHAPVEPAPMAELQSLLGSVRPNRLALIGIGGWAIILFLMIFKPF